MNKSSQGLLARMLRSSRGLIHEAGMPTTLLGRLATPGLHERQISRDLGEDRLRFEGNAPLFDKPLVLLAFTNRSGSSLLADYMRQSRMFLGMGEFSNHDFVRNQMAKRELENFPSLIWSLAAKAGPRQLFGLKVSWDQMAMLARWNIPAMFTGLKIVHITRSDPLAQAISYSIADQTRQWTSIQQASAQTPVFNAEDIDRIMREQQTQDALIRVVAQAMDAPPYGVVYEGLCANPTGHMRAILAFCGVARPHWEVQESVLQKQAGQVNQAFRTAWLEHAHEKMFGSKPDTAPTSATDRDETA